MKKIIPLICLSVILLTPVVASAAPLILADSLKDGPDSVITLMDRITNWMFTFFLILAVILVLIAAYEYLLSRGGAEEITKAHRMMIYSAVSIAVAVLAKGIVIAVEKIAGNS